MCLARSAHGMVRNPVVDPPLLPPTLSVHRVLFSSACYRSKARPIIAAQIKANSGTEPIKFAITDGQAPVGNAVCT